MPTRDVPAFTLMVADPEREIGWVCHGAARPATGVDGTPVRSRTGRRHLETAPDRLEEIA